MAFEQAAHHPIITFSMPAGSWTVVSNMHDRPRGGCGKLHRVLKWPTGSQAWRDALARLGLPGF